MSVIKALTASVPVILVTATAFVACRSARTPEAAASPRVAVASAATPVIADEAPAHVRGMWVWATRRRLDRANGTASLLETVQMAKLTEVYLSANDGVLEDPRLPALVGELQRAGVRVEALSGDATWYLPEKRGALFGFVDRVVAYNAKSPAKFAAIHLDIEPHQIPDNRGRHGFLPALADAIEAARERAAASGLGTSADLPRFAFEEEGLRFAKAADRMFVMLYQLSQRTPQWLVRQSEKVIEKTYRELPDDARGRMVVGVRVEDYGKDLEEMVDALDRGLEGRTPRYGGWAIHDEAKFRAR